MDCSHWWPPSPHSLWLDSPAGSYPGTAFPDLPFNVDVQVMIRAEVLHASTCGSSGAPGPGAEGMPETLASDLRWLADWRRDVFEYSPARQPGARAASTEIAALVTERAGDCLPAVGVDGVIPSTGADPTRVELGDFALRTSASVGLRPRP